MTRLFDTIHGQRYMGISLECVINSTLSLEKKHRLLADMISAQKAVIDEAIEKMQETITELHCHSITQQGEVVGPINEAMLNTQKQIIEEQEVLFLHASQLSMTLRTLVNRHIHGDFLQQDAWPQYPM